MSKYPREAKLEMIRAYREEHRSINWITEHYGISASYLRQLLELEESGQTEGIGAGQSGRKKRKYPGTFKLNVVKERIATGLGYREIARKYGVTHQNVMQWERIYLECGETGLLEEQRGKAMKEGYASSAGERRKLDKNVERDLIAEVQRLRMENEYLKKLQALVKEGKKSPKE